MKNFWSRFILVLIFKEYIYSKIDQLFQKTLKKA